MLVLSRKLNEKIHLGDNITVTVLRVSGNTIRLGIDAPRDVRVLRGELEPLNDERPTRDQLFQVISEDSSADTIDEEPDTVAGPIVSGTQPRVASPLADFVAVARRPMMNVSQTL